MASYQRKPEPRKCHLGFGTVPQCPKMCKGVCGFVPKNSRSRLYGDPGPTAGWREKRAERKARLAAALAAYDPMAEPADIHPAPTVDVIPRVIRELEGLRMRAMCGDLDTCEHEDLL